jgi:molybdopterin converting factor subunit 1
MRIQVRLFAVCRDRAGTDHLDLDLPGDKIDIDGLKSAVAEAVPAIAPLMQIVRVAVNQTFAVTGDEIVEGDEIALIPPVSGGSGQSLFEIRSGPVTSQEVEDAVRHPGAGAVCSFLGTVRDDTKGHVVTALEYEAYEEMAEKYLRLVGEEVQTRWPGTRIAILHRTGYLEPGIASVAISVSSPHRAHSFDGCRHAIERLKEDVPIWKKELRADGSVWVGVGS